MPEVLDPARTRHDWLRWATLVLFVLAALAFALPFLSYRLELGGAPETRVIATYSGFDPVVDGWADTASSVRDESGRWREEGRDTGKLLPAPDPGGRLYAAFALVILAVGVAAAALKGLVRVVTSAAAALLAVMSVTAATMLTRQAIENTVARVNGDSPIGTVDLRYGFWLCLGALAVIAMANVWRTRR